MLMFWLLLCLVQHWSDDVVDSAEHGGSRGGHWQCCGDAGCCWEPSSRGVQSRPTEQLTSAGIQSRHKSYWRYKVVWIEICHYLIISYYFIAGSAWWCNEICRLHLWLLAIQCYTATLGKWFTSVCFCHQTVCFGTVQRAVMPYGW